MTAPLGKRAEDAAAEYLSRKGYRVLERNVRSRLGEIDIVAQNEDCLVFVEVKAGSGDPDFPPKEHYDWKKNQKLKTLAKAYMEKHGPGHEARIDLLEVVQRGETFEFDHFENVTED
jgi:putative endonuclease